MLEKNIEKKQSSYRVEEQYNGASQTVHHLSVPMSNPQQLSLFASLSYDLPLKHNGSQLDWERRYRKINKKLIEDSKVHT